MTQPTLYYKIGFGLGDFAQPEANERVWDMLKAGWVKLCAQ
jgi:hypothetical protein